MSARKSLPRYSAAQLNRLSIQSHQSQISGVLNPDSYVDSDDNENPLWFKNYENHSISSRPSARFSVAHSDTPNLNPDSEPESTPLEKSWWKHVDHTPGVGGSTANVSRQHDRKNIDEASYVESSVESSVDETVAKKRPAPRHKKNRSLQQNVFSEILESARDSTLSRKNLQDLRSEEKQQNRSESKYSDTSSPDEGVAKKRPAPHLKNRTTIRQDVFSGILETSRNSVNLEKKAQNVESERGQQNKSHFESSETSSLDESVAKQRRALYLKKRKSSQQDIFSGILESSKNATRHEEDVQDTRNKEKQQNKSTLESSNTSSLDEPVARTRRALHVKKRKRLQQNVFSEILELAKDSTSSRKDVQYARDEDKQQNRSKSKSDTSSPDESIAKKRPVSHSKTRKSLRQDISSDISELSKDSINPEKNVEDVQNDGIQQHTSHLESSDISYEDEFQTKIPLGALPQEQRSLRENVVSNISELAKSLTSSEQVVRNVQGKVEQTSLTSSSLSDISIVKASQPSVKKKNTKAFQKSRHLVASSDKEGSPDCFESALDVSESVGENDDTNATEKLHVVKSGPEPKFFDDSDETIHLAVESDRSRSPIIKTRPKKQSIFTKTSKIPKKTPNFDELLDTGSSDEEVDDHQANEANVELDHNEPRSPALVAQQNDSPVDEDNSDTEESIRKQRIPLSHKKRKSQHKKTFSELLESPNTSNRPEEASGHKQTEKFSSPKHNISSLNVHTRSAKERSLSAKTLDPLNTSGRNNESARKQDRLSSRTNKPNAERQSTNKRNNRGETSSPSNIGVAANQANAADKSAIEEQLVNKENDDLENSESSNDGFEKSDLENAAVSPSNGSEKLHDSIQNKKSFDQSQINQERLSAREITTPRRVKKKSVSKRLSDKGDDKLGSRPVIVRVENINIPRKLLNLSSNSNESGATNRSINKQSNDNAQPFASPIIEVETDRSYVSAKSGADKLSINKDNNESEDSKSSNHEPDGNESNIALARRSSGLKKPQDSIENRKSLHQSQINKGRTSTQKTIRSIGVYKESASKHSSDISDEDDEHASGLSERRSRKKKKGHTRTSGSPNIEVEANQSHVSTKSGVDRLSINKDNDELEDSKSSNAESEKNESEIPLARRSSGLRKPQDSIENRKSLNGSQINRDRTSTQGTIKSIGVDKESASKLLLDFSDEDDDENASGRSERRSRKRKKDHARMSGSPGNIEIEANRSHVTDKSSRKKQSMNKENPVDTVQQQSQINEDQLSTKNKSSGGRNKSRRKELSRSIDGEERDEENDSDGTEHPPSSSGIIDKTQKTLEHSNNKRSQSQDKIDDDDIRKTRTLNVSNNVIVTRTKRKSTATLHSKLTPEPVQKNNVVETSKSRKSYFTADTESSELAPLMVRSETAPVPHSSEALFQETITEKLTQIKSALDEVKNKEFATMKNSKIDSYFKQVSVKKANIPTSQTQSTRNKKKTITKTVNKAYIVNGQVYHKPKLPRPQHWATDRLYKYLWKRMEPKYKLNTRLRSEKFVRELGEVVTFIKKCKVHQDYKAELNNLIREMARLEIIKTRHEFHVFCQTFLPHEFRIKVIPMILPGNVRNIPFEPEELNRPISIT